MMNFDDKLFWLVVTMPYIQCIISFVLGGVIGAVAMAILDALPYYKDPNNIERSDDDGI